MSVSRRTNTPQELKLLVSFLPAFNSSEPRSNARRSVIDACTAKLNEVSPGQWDLKRTRQWLGNNKSNENVIRKSKSLSMSSSSVMSVAAARPRVEERMLSKRSSSCSQFTATPPMSSGAVKNKELRKLGTFFTLEHTRLPKVPRTIFEVTSGEELASQLAFNWTLEERIAGSLKVIYEMEHNCAPNAMDGTLLLTSGINPFDAAPQDEGSGGGGGAYDTHPHTPTYEHNCTPMQDDHLASFFGDDDEFGMGLGDLADDPALVLFGGAPSSTLRPSSPFFMSSSSRPNSPLHGEQQGLEDLVCFEAHHCAALEDDGSLQPMVDDWGPACSIRDGHATAFFAPLSESGEARQALVTSSGRLIMATQTSNAGWRGSSSGDVNSGPIKMLHTTLERDAVSLEEVVLEADDVGPLRALQVDEERQNFWVAAGKYITGYDLSDTSRGALYRLVPDVAGASNKVSLLARGPLLFCATGQYISGWDLDELEVTSSSDMSSQMEFESVSSFSEGDSSPPLSAADSDFYGSDRFSGHLNAALGAQFCHCCGVGFTGNNQRQCSECSHQVCVACANIYKLTSLGESSPRPICNGCIPSIRKRIMAQKASSRMPQLVERGPSNQRRRPSVSQHRLKPCLPQNRQEVTSRAGSGVTRVISELKADYVAPESFHVAFEDRPCALSWNLNHKCASRWFVGHTGAITSLSSMPLLPNTIATGSADQSAKIWDARVRRAGMTLQGHSGSISDLTLVQFSSATFCFTGGADQCVKVWDLRKQLPLYELSTGNNRVDTLDWNRSTNSLVCSTTMIGDATTAWPKEAIRGPKHFPRVWNAGSHQVLQYDFTTCL